MPGEEEWIDCGVIGVRDRRRWTPQAASQRRKRPLFPLPSNVTSIAAHAHGSVLDDDDPHILHSMEVDLKFPFRPGTRTNGQRPQVDSKKPSFLSRLKSTLDKDIWTRSPQKKRPVQPPAGRLPQELMEYIIDHLWYHLESLLACCLTCRAWVEPSRYHLFYRRRLLYEYQYKSLSNLRRHGLIGYIRRIEMDLLPPFDTKSPTFRYLKDMGSATSLRSLALTEYHIFHSPVSARLAQATSSLVTLELINPEGASSDILRFIFSFPNLDNLSVVRHTKWGSKPAPQHGTLPSFRGVLTLKYMNSVGKDGLVQGLLKIPGGLRFHTLVLKCNEGVEPLIRACSRTLKTLFYQPWRSGVRQ